ncbi:peptidoglycan-binding domain-containing protein [Jannaschia sp. CCS1]|uniref:peptidoglycan-binding domain-containing protein n=1 Tax=Jannaschia sp. (strain CCS1) TaxID=290400 RepID=UPI000053C992|nr:hypothetical protein [Jannaschia sp. CCS1]ABD56239.1 hypothetical protein Jann_3322 [Jannaschia sp. CCS1]
MAYRFIPVLAAALISTAGAAVAGPDELCVQEVLAIHGYDPGPIDGHLGPRTRQIATDFARDWRLDLPALSASTVADWCVALPAAQRGAGQPQDPALTDGPDALGCVEAPPDGYARIITGMVDGDPVELRVSARFGGAVGGLTWRGRQFLNIYDHGRQISYAWHLDGHGECLNPTEPGSAQDYFLQSSTTRVLQICGEAPNRLSTRINPAYWTAPGEAAFCDNGTTGGVNTTLVSENLFEKVIQIGYRGIENVILFDATITLERDYQSLRTEMPTAYLTHDFTARYSFDPRDGTLIPREESMDLYPPFSFVHVSNLPAVLATEDGQFALGAYTAIPGASYELLHYDVPNPYDANNKWNILVGHVPAPAGPYSYRAFAVIGTLEQVRASMVELAALHPVDVTPGWGFVDYVGCDEVAGWAWDPDAPDVPMMVDLRDLGTGEIVLSVLADAYRADLPGALGDDGRHAFRIPAEDLPDGPVTLAADVRASVDGLPGIALTPNQFSLDCGG